jgi:small subunit ribosomal protein S20
MLYFPFVAPRFAGAVFMFRHHTRGSSVARKARTWKGARTPQALKRVRQALRRRAVNRRARSETKTLVQHASSIALGRAEGDGQEAIRDAISALDKAAEKGIIHPNNAARRKSRLMAKANAAHLLDADEIDATGPKRKSVATKTAQRKKVAAAKASKAAAARAADRPRTAAGKAKVAVTRASRESAAARRRAHGTEPTEDTPEG